MPPLQLLSQVETRLLFATQPIRNLLCLVFRIRLRTASLGVQDRCAVGINLDATCAPRFQLTGGSPDCHAICYIFPALYRQH